MQVAKLCTGAGLAICLLAGAKWGYWKPNIGFAEPAEQNTAGGTGIQNERSDGTTGFSELKELAKYIFWHDTGVAIRNPKPIFKIRSASTEKCLYLGATNNSHCSRVYIEKGRWCVEWCDDDLEPVEVVVVEEKGTDAIRCVLQCVRNHPWKKEKIFPP